MTDYSGIASFNQQPQASSIPAWGIGQSGLNANLASYGIPTSQSLSALGGNGGFNGGDGSNYSLATAGQGVGPVTPTGGGFGGWLGKDGNFAASVQGLSALTSAYLGFQQLGQAKDALKFQKDAFGKNLANSTKTYNTSLEDRINGRTSEHAGKAEEVQAYLKAHSL